MNPSTYLIVEQQQQQSEELPELLQELAKNHHLDIYQCRQRLVGQGLSLLTKGSEEELQKISLPLQMAGFTHWLIEPSKPLFVPQRLRSLQVSNEKIRFICQKKSIDVAKGANILAVFAEMSGELAEKSVKQLLSSHAYRGRDDIRQLEQHKIHRTILQGQPLLDLYLLDVKKQIVDAVRIFPGKFDPKGLGERATISSKQNLEQILKLAEEYAGDFTLATDFGLVNLPGCTLRRENPDAPETQRQNQLSLARYGWLRADLLRVGPLNQQAEGEQNELTGAISAALLLQNPKLAASGQQDEILPLAKELTDEIDKATAAYPKIKGPAPEIADDGLPAPPSATQTNAWNKPSFWFGSSSAAIVVVIIFLFEIDSRGILTTVVRHAFSSGSFLFLLSALLFWSGFHFIRLRRQIENTPTSKIRSIAMGMVEVKGRAIRRYALISPMSHTACVFYRLTKYHRKQNNQWTVTSTSSSANVPFFLEDNTGRVEIDPARCRVSAGTKQEGTPGQIGLARFSDDSDDKWVEELIVEGTLIYVLGFAAVKKDASPTLTERKIEALRELKRNPQDIRQFDADGDGKISSDEWDTARKSVEEQVMHTELQKKQQRKKQEEHVMISKKSGRPLIIAESHSEAHLLRRYALYTIPLFIAAAATLGWGIYNLSNYLH